MCPLGVDVMSKTNWIDNEKYLVAGPNGSAMNAMKLARRVCKIRNLDALMKDAYEGGCREDAHDGARSMSAYGASRSAEMIWSRTDELKGAHRVDGRVAMMTIRLSKPKNNSRGKGAHANRRRGISVYLAGDAARIIEVIIHELTHIFHLNACSDTRVAGKRRPHCYTFNRLMLLITDKIIGLTEKQKNPFTHGYRISAGYAPSRALEKIIEQKIADREEKVMRLFDEKMPEPKPGKPKKPRFPRGGMNKIETLWTIYDRDWGTELHDDVLARVSNKMRPEEFAKMSNEERDAFWAVFNDTEQDDHCWETEFMDYQWSESKENRIQAQFDAVREWFTQPVVADILMDDLLTHGPPVKEEPAPVSTNRVSITPPDFLHHGSVVASEHEDADPRVSKLVEFKSHSLNDLDAMVRILRNWAKENGMVTGILIQSEASRKAGWPVPCMLVRRGGE